MEWKEITEDLPSEKSFVLAKVNNYPDLFLCCYKNDSFGLGDLDWEIERWIYLVKNETKELRKKELTFQSN